MRIPFVFWFRLTVILLSLFKLLLTSSSSYSLRNSLRKILQRYQARNEAEQEVGNTSHEIRGSKVRYSLP